MQGLPVDDDLAVTHSHEAAEIEHRATRLAGFIDEHVHEPSRILASLLVYQPPKDRDDFLRRKVFERRLRFGRCGRGRRLGRSDRRRRFQ